MKCPTCKGTGLIHAMDLIPRRVEILYYRHIKHKTFQQIADLLAIKKSTVSYYLKRYSMDDYEWLNRVDINDINNPEALAVLEEEGLI